MRTGKADKECAVFYTGKLQFSFWCRVSFSPAISATFFVASVNFKSAKSAQQ